MASMRPSLVLWLGFLALVAAVPDSRSAHNFLEVSELSPGQAAIVDKLSGLLTSINSQQQKTHEELKDFQAKFAKKIDEHKDLISKAEADVKSASACVATQQAIISAAPAKAAKIQADKIPAAILVSIEKEIAAVSGREKAIEAEESAQQHVFAKQRAHLAAIRKEVFSVLDILTSDYRARQQQSPAFLQLAVPTAAEGEPSALSVDAAPKQLTLQHPGGPILVHAARDVGGAVFQKLTDMQRRFAVESQKVNESETAANRLVVSARSRAQQRIKALTESLDAKRSSNNDAQQQLAALNATVAAATTERAVCAKQLAAARASLASGSTYHRAWSNSLGKLNRVYADTRSGLLTNMHHQREIVSTTQSLVKKNLPPPQFPKIPGGIKVDTEGLTPMAAIAKMETAHCSRNGPAYWCKDAATMKLCGLTPALCVNVALPAAATTNQTASPAAATGSAPAVPVAAKPGGNSTGTSATGGSSSPTRDEDAAANVAEQIVASSAAATTGGATGGAF